MGSGFGFKDQRVGGGWRFIDGGYLFLGFFDLLDELVIEDVPMLVFIVFREGVVVAFVKSAFVVLWEIK